jgi:hypothetical protein
MRIGRGGWGSAGPTSAGAGSESFGLERAIRKVGRPIPTVRRKCKQPSDRSSAASADQETLPVTPQTQRFIKHFFDLHQMQFNEHYKYGSEAETRFFSRIWISIQIVAGERS